MQSIDSVLEMNEEPLNVSMRVPAPLWRYHTQLCHVLGFFPMGIHTETRGEDCVVWKCALPTHCLPTPNTALNFCISSQM